MGQPSRRGRKGSKFGRHRMRRYRQLTPPERLESRELLATVAFHWSAAEQASEAVAPAAESASGFLADKAASSRWTGLELTSYSGPPPVYGPTPLAPVLRGEGSGGEGLAASAPTIDSLGAIADGFLDQHKQTLGVQDVARELEPIRAESDGLGMTLLRYQQVYQGIPVYGSEMLVHLGPDSAVRSANGRLVSAIALDTTPQVSPDEAIALAQIFFSRSRPPNGTSSDPLAPSVTDSAPSLPDAEYVDLYVLNKGLLDNTDDPVSHLAWEVHLVQADLGVNESYFVDAHTGELLEQLDGNRYLTRGVCDCSVRDGLCHINEYYSQYNYTFGRSEGKPPVGPNPIMGGSTDTDNVYDLLAFIHNDVLLARFGCDGGNGRGGIGDGKSFQWTSTMAYVHVEKMDPGFCSETGGAGFTWGSDVSFCSGHAVPDIIAHEYAHSIPYYSHFNAQGRPVPMVYQGESGALQENFSDAFGEAVEYYRFGHCDWLFGAEASDGRYRNSVDPPSAPTPPGIRYPDRYLSPNFYSGTNDDGGVHVNATILDKAFYLTALGGQFNDYEVQGLGIDKAIQVWYRAVTQYYTTTETFNDAYYDLIQAATDLYGAVDAEEVRKALEAVELNLTRPSSEAQVAMIDQVTKPTPSVSSVSAHFAQGSNIAELLASPGGDGSITSAVTLVNLDDGPVPLDPAQFTYDAATRTLTLTSATPLPAGYYQLQVRGDLLQDDQGRQLRGGTAGLAFSGPAFGTIQTVKAGGADLRVNSDASPTLADWNSDGLVDLVVGEQMADGEAKLRVYLNSGTAISPKFTSFSYARSGANDLAVPGGDSGVSSRLVDWNHDGLPDLILGLTDGRVQFWPNVNTAADPQFGTPVDLEAGEPGAKSPVNVGAQAMVEVADWNDDGRMDLIVGGLDGRVRVYLDQAATGLPDLRGPLVVQDGAEDLVVPVDAAAPAVIDLDGDGCNDLVVGNSQGRLLGWLNRGSDAQPQFDGWFALPVGVGTERSPMKVPASARVTVGDWNSDGLPDLIFGAANGRVQTAPTLSRAAPAESEPWVGARGGTYLYNFSAPPPSPLSVTINQAADQADPTNSETVHFTVVFSEPVTDFAAADVTVGSTAGATQVSVGPATDNGTTYDVAVSGFANDGTVIVSLASGVAHDAAGNDNSASTSTDNRVMVDRVPLTVGIVPVTPDPRNTAVTAVTIQFSEAVTGVEVSAVRLTRNGQVVDLSGLPVTAVSNSRWTVDLSSLTTAAGAYVLTLEGTGTNIRDLAGNALTVGVSETFVIHPRQNVGDVYDVNDDGAVTPSDVLDVINELNAHGSGPVLSPADGLPLFLDVNGDDTVDPSDVLSVINFLNHSTAQASVGEGEDGLPFVASAKALRISKISWRYSCVPPKWPRRALGHVSTAR